MARRKTVNDDPGSRDRSTRRMTVIAQRSGGPATATTSSWRTIDVRRRGPRAGPIGYRVQVVDFDSTERVFRGSHDLPATYDEEPKAWHEGNASIERDFRFHAQNTYALVMKTLARFEFALGRRIPWSFRTHQLKVAPHGMADANAFYSPEAEGLVFGYFNGSSGEPVFTCLSHDIVVHETTHALLDALRERYLDPSNPDQAAFHEGFADVIALLSVFSQPEVVEHLLLGDDKPSSRVNLIGRSKVLPNALRKSALFGLAEQMGSELEGVRGKPLRPSAQLEPSPKLKDADRVSRAAPTRRAVRRRRSCRASSMPGRGACSNRGSKGSRSARCAAWRRKARTSRTRSRRCGSARSTTCRRCTCASAMRSAPR